MAKDDSKDPQVDLNFSDLDGGKVEKKKDKIRRLSPHIVESAQEVFLAIPEDGEKYTVMALPNIDGQQFIRWIRHTYPALSFYPDPSVFDGPENLQLRLEYIELIAKYAKKRISWTLSQQGIKYEELVH